MSASPIDLLVENYLARLDTAAAALPARDRVELVAEIREHIEAAQAAGSAANEAAVRTLLDRLGPPEDIVAAATDGETAQPGVPVSRAPVPRPSTRLELAALLLMTLGSIVPLVGWLVGAGCLVASRLWRPWEKLLGLIVVPLGPFGALLLAGLLGAGVSGSSTCTSGPVAVPATDQSVALAQDVPVHCTDSGGGGLPAWAGITLLVLVVVAPLVVDVWIYQRAMRRADAMAAVPV